MEEDESVVETRFSSSHFWCSYVVNIDELWNLESKSNYDNEDEDEFFVVTRFSLWNLNASKNHFIFNDAF